MNTQRREMRRWPPKWSIRWRRCGAASTATSCTAATFKTDSLTDATSHVKAKWVVPNAGTARSVKVILTYRGGSRQVVDTMLTTIYCN